MGSNKKSAAGYTKKYCKLTRLITKFEHSLEKTAAVETRMIHNLHLSEREIYYILEALKILKEDLKNENVLA